MVVILRRAAGRPIPYLGHHIQRLKASLAIDPLDIDRGS
jgi:hypothetical protein